VLLLAAAAVAGCLLYATVLNGSARFAEQNRELLLSNLTQDEGPIVTE
jgi:hypothetical protein